MKGKQISQNKFEAIVNKVMQYKVREEIEVRKQVVEEVKCFRCWRVEHHKWEYPSIEVERRRHEEIVVCMAILQKAQQKRRPFHPTWKKVQLKRE